MNKPITIASMTNVGVGGGGNNNWKVSTNSLEKCTTNSRGKTFNSVDKIAKTDKGP